MNEVMARGLITVVQKQAGSILMDLRHKSLDFSLSKN